MIVARIDEPVRGYGLLTARPALLPLLLLFLLLLLFFSGVYEKAIGVATDVAIQKKKRAAFAGVSASDRHLNLLCVLFLLSFLPSHPLSTPPKLLRHCAPLPLLPLDNKPLHSSADSSSPKATLIVLKHTAPVKLIIALACFHSIAGPQRLRQIFFFPPARLLASFLRRPFKCSTAKNPSHVSHVFPFSHSRYLPSSFILTCKQMCLERRLETTRSKR